MKSTLKIVIKLTFNSFLMIFVLQKRDKFKKGNLLHKLELMICFEYYIIWGSINMFY